MFGVVNRRFVRGLIYMLVAGQVLLSAPIVEAATSVPSAASVAMPCADSMPAAEHEKPCPCCPDGARNVATCLSACAAAVGDVATLLSFSIPTPVQSVATPVAQGAIGATDPPLKPPPIV